MIEKTERTATTRIPSRLPPAWPKGERVTTGGRRAKITYAASFIDALLTVPGIDISKFGREWSTLRQVCLDHAFSANDVPDAWIAAPVRAVGTHLVTFDRGFLGLRGRSERTVLPLEPVGGVR